MNTRTTRVAALALAAWLLLAMSGGAQAALQGRDLDGNAATFEAYYDTDLNITWLANANYAKTSSYTPDGSMSWDAANTWAADLSIVDSVNNITYNNWRLPTVSDTGAPGCDFAFTGTDCGYNVDTATGEMAHLFYDELGNKAYFPVAGASPQPGWGLTNTGPFTNLQGNYFWYGTEFGPSPGRAWMFGFVDGYQFTTFYKAGEYSALAVSDGDVGAVPEADAWTMLLAGLGLVATAVRRRRG